MLKVGLTGGMATGKTVAGAELERLGCHLLKADEVAHRLMLPDGPCYGPIVALFGTAILDENKTIDRGRLAKLVFAEPAALEKLNSIVHPAVFAYEKAWMVRVEESKSDPILIVEAAILIETGSYKTFDKLIVTWCPEKLMIERAMTRSGWSEMEVRRRLARQLPAEEKKRYADYLIDTSGPVDETLERTRAVYAALRSV